MASPVEEAAPGSVLLFDGVFLLRPELFAYWDVTIFVHADFDEIVRRAETRDQEQMGGVENVRDRYRKRYIPGQQLYFERCAPQQKADIVLDNTDPAEPKLVRFPSSA